VLVGYDKYPHGEPNEPVFRYSVKLPRDKWFFQNEPNGVYWFSVVAVYGESWPNYDWGWTNHKHVYNDDAVAGYIDPAGGTWGWEELYDQTQESEDMSFILFTEPDCMKRTHPDYSEWVNVGRPDCWCYPRQCNGDVDAAKEYGVYWVLLNDLAEFKTYFQVVGVTGPPGICCDFAHDTEYGVYRVLLNDLNIFKTYFQATSVPCCDDDGDCILTGDTRFNFWTAAP
jgi:hypothetical protein